MSNQVGHLSFQGHYSNIKEERRLVVEEKYTVEFVKPYPDGKIPKVFTAMSFLDCTTSDRNTRIRVNVESITNKNFIIHVESWDNSETWQVDVAWFASIHEGIQIGKVSHQNLKGDQNSTDNVGQQSKKERIIFPIRFPSDGPTPRVAAFIKSLDIDSRGNTRISVNISEIDREGFTLESNTWFDSYIYNASFYWIASTSPTVHIKKSIGGLDDPKVFREFSDLKWRTASKELSIPELKKLYEDAKCSPPLSVHHISGLTQLDFEREFNTRIHVETNPSYSSKQKLLSKFSIWWDSRCYTLNACVVSTICLTSEQKIIRVGKFPELPPDYELIPYLKKNGTLKNADGSVSQGYHGTTFHVRHKLDSHHYALKMIKDFNADKDAYLRELNNLAELPFHNNILRYFTCAMFKERLFIAAEYIDGCTFGSLTYSNPPPSKVRIRTVALQLFSGLKHFHMKPMVHRDIHETNILLRYKQGTNEVDYSNPRCVVIIDVGNARQVAKRGQNVSFIPGVTRYYSPERFEGKPLNDKDDVWAAACLICELVVGEAFPSHEVISDFLIKVMYKDEDLGLIMNSILTELDPEKRPSSDKIKTELAIFC